MATYEEIKKILIEEESATTFYRFQGPNSFEYFNIKTNRFEDDENHYVYFSKTLNHHYYFTIRRIRQLLNKIILEKSGYIISNNELENDEHFNNIVNLIINQQNIKCLRSISLICDSNYYNLLRENCVCNMKRKITNSIERVDRKIYGGGFGVNKEWLDLMNNLTFFSSNIRITSLDIVSLLRSMKKTGKLTIPYLISDILERKERTYYISNNIFNDFHKYSIMNNLELIYDKKIYLDGSNFANNPTKHIKGVLKDYQDKREKILRLVESKYQKYCSKKE